MTDAERRTDYAKRCPWSGCRQYSPPGDPLPLCGIHRRIVTEALDGEKQRAKEAAEAAAAKIDAGTRLESYERPPGWVYYIKIDDTIKIGYATNVYTRMRAYPPSAKLLAVEPGTKTIERRRHGHFNAYLSHGREWFRDCQEIRDWTDRLVTEYGNPAHMAYEYTTPDKTPVVAGKHFGGRR